MNVLKLLATLMVLGGAVAMAFGTGAFAAINADRLADVGVASDDSALLGITIEGGSADPGEQVTLVTVENRLGSAMDSMEVTVVNTGPFDNVEIQQVPDSLPAGGTGDITAMVAGSPSTSGTIEIRIIAVSASGNSVDLTREVYVEIDSPSVGVCTIENDDRIGERSFTEEGAFFDCTIRIDADNPYEVEFEESTVTGGFEFTSDKPLQGFEFEENKIGDTVEITLNSNLVDDLEIDDTEIGGDLVINISGQANSDITIDGTNISGDLILNIEQLNSELTIEESEIGGDLTVNVDSRTGAGSVSVEENGNEVGGEKTINIGSPGGGPPGG